MIELYYSDKHPNQGDIPQFNFEEDKDVLPFLQAIHEKADAETVYLLAFENRDIEAPIIVFDNFGYIRDRIVDYALDILDDEDIAKGTEWDFVIKVFLFEFNSYEEAYKTALDMKETNPLCYNTKTPNQ
jgi:hypothetical protein